MEKPSLSIIIPALNEERCLPLLLEDLARQTFRDFEVILVDGKSEDNTVAKARSFAQRFRQFTVLTSDKRNVSFQRNLGSRNAQADWLVFMDADNRLPAYFLQGIKYRLDSLNPDILTSWISTDTDNKKEQTVATAINLFIEIQKNTNQPYTMESMLCFKKTAFFRLNGFDPALPWGEGNDLLRRAKRKNLRYEVVHEPRYTYSLRRLRKQGTLKSIRNAAEIELARFRNKQLPREKATYLYPMEGGAYWEEFEKKPNPRLKWIIGKLTRINPLAKAERPKNFLQKLFRLD